MTNVVRHSGDTKRFLLDNKPGNYPRIPQRMDLLWLAGQRGKPGLNADILSTTEATREIADPYFEVLGTNMTSALCTFNAEGGVTLTTAGADADQAILAPHLDANQSAWTSHTWGTDRETYWECLFDTGANLVVRAEVPGMEHKDLDVTLHEGTLTVKGSRADAIPDGYTAHRRERGAIEFARSFGLPCKVDPEKAKANLDDGVLTLTMAKSKEVQPRQIPVGTRQ